MKKISDKPKCFSITLKEIKSNNFILSPKYYLDKKEHNKYNKWFSGLELEQKRLLKEQINYVKYYSEILQEYKKAFLGKEKQ